MKKAKQFAAILSLSLCATFVTNAQESTSLSPWSFGVKGGVNIINSRENTGFDAGLNLGGTVDYSLSDRFFLRSGLEFTTKHAVSKNYRSIYNNYYGPQDTYNSDFTSSRSTLFLQVPLSLGYKLPIAKNVNLTFNAGVFAGIGLLSNANYDKWVYIAPQDRLHEYDQYRNEGGYSSDAGNFDFGLMGGIGIEYKKFSLNANYEHGLVNQVGYKGNNGKPESLHNQNVTITVGYKF